MQGGDRKGRGRRTGNYYLSWFGLTLYGSPSGGNVPTTTQVTPPREKSSRIPLTSAEVDPESLTNVTPSPQLYTV